MNVSANSRPAGRVLLIDDEPAILKTFRYCLEDADFRVAAAQSSQQAMMMLQREVFDVCFLDLRLGEESGLDLLPELRAAAPWMRVVVVTAHSSVDSAVGAMQAGASDYLVKPCSPEQLRHAAQTQAEARRLESRVQQLESELQSSDLDLRSESPVMMQLLGTTRNVATTDATVLILGDSGTGKGELAKALHRWSDRASGPFVTINCPSLSAELLESELFGHQKGAFTGATESTEGRVGQADGGTLFLDEIGDFPLQLQPKLLRFIQDKEYERVGDPVTRRADVRIVAATNRDLGEMARNGEFREDLLYRLNVITLELPPLRERPEDLQMLAEGFLSRFAASYNRPARRFSRDAMTEIMRYSWPGNIRELRNVIERVAIICTEEEVSVRDLALKGMPDSGSTHCRVGDPISLGELEKAHIMAVLAASSSLEAAARTLGIDTSTLYRKRKQLGI
ncbi:MAG: sigma-54 dependent transcriptional regulator [Spongiibacteraceae bacterium]|jgi:NtrC-family two-component system response regulator AlgB|nr:sigma-54 dependent transcriptional regulator [Spongiibacteraceae bacterium]